MAGFTKLYVDDIRDLPKQYQDEGVWTIARSFHEAITKLELIDFVEVSLDHDLGSFYGNRELTGYDIAMWLAMRKMEGYKVPPYVYVHSANPSGRDNIQSIIDHYLS